LFSAHPLSALAKLKNCSRPCNFPQAIPKSQPKEIAYLTSTEFNHFLQLNLNCKEQKLDYAIENTTLLEFYEKSIKVDIDQSIKINQLTSSQNSSIWKNERRLRITASVCYELFTYAKNKSPDWKRKINNMHKDIHTSAMMYGKNTEKLAFECYKKEEPDVKISGLCINPKLCWLGGSPDGIVVNKSKVLEIKCPVKFSKEDVTFEKVSFFAKPPGSTQYFLKKKHVYYGQVQLNMHILNCKTLQI
jgi:hypothetical protein